MTQEVMKKTACGSCPLCDASITTRNSAEISEVLTCPECCSCLVVESLNGNRINFEEAPVIEEDWGQ